MLNRLPKSPQALADILAELGNPKAAQIARAFGVTTRTAQGWIKNGAPRAVLLSLYWLTNAGRSCIEAEVHNMAQMYEGLARARLAEIKRLEAQVSGLLAIGEFGAANDPVLTPCSGIRSVRFGASEANSGLRPTTPPTRLETRRLS